MLFRKYYCIKQQEPKDCGCTCLATIFKQFGLKIPIYKIRDLAKTDLYGTSVYGLTMAAEKLGCSAKAFMFDDKTQLLTNKDLIHSLLSAPGNGTRCLRGCFRHRRS